MSVMRRDGTKVLLPRSGVDPFWERVLEHLDTERDVLWRYLAMLTLQEVAGWTLEQIGRAFGHNRGHVSRCLDRIREELRVQVGVTLDRHQPEKRCAAPNAADERRARHQSCDDQRFGPVRPVRKERSVRKART